MATIVINERTKIGNNVLKMLRTLAKVDDNKSIKFIDETEYLLSTEANRKLNNFNHMKRAWQNFDTNEDD